MTKPNKKQNNVKIKVGNVVGVRVSSLHTTILTQHAPGDGLLYYKPNTLT